MSEPDHSPTDSPAYEDGQLSHNGDTNGDVHNTSIMNGHSNGNGNGNGNGSAYGQAPPTPSGVVRKKLGGFVGFANLPNQVQRRSIR